MNAWEKLGQVNLPEKEKYIRVFVKTFKQIQAGEFNLRAREEERKNYFLMVEEERAGGWFVHVVPKELYELFKALQHGAPNSFLGFSVVAGNYNGREVRVSCFGVQCNELGLALARTTKRSRSYRLHKKGFKERQRLAAKAAKPPKVKV